MKKIFGTYKKNNNSIGATYISGRFKGFKCIVNTLKLHNILNYMYLIL